MNPSSPERAGPRGEALVVGGTGGIGRAVARTLGGLGYRLTLAARDRSRLDAACAELARDGIEARASVCDLADAAEAEALVPGVASSSGRLDVVVNAAGIASPGFVQRLSADDLDRQHRVNFAGPALVCKAALVAMKRAGRGTIVNIGSLAARDGHPGFAAYSASKGALHAFGGRLAGEAARYGIRVCTIIPDRVDTAMVPGRGDGLTLIPPEDVARAIAFVLSLDRNTFVPEIVLLTPPGRPDGG